MNKLGEKICKNKKLILILGIILMIPALIGMYKTKVNYDILVYLPEDIETVQGENILTQEFNMGAFALTVIDNMADKDVIALENKIRDIDGINKVLSINDITGTTIPIEFLPSDITKKFAKDDSKLMLITFNESTSDDKTLEAVETLREVVGDHCKIGGMSAMVLDTKDLFTKEMTFYIIIAVILCIIILMISLDSYLVPILLLANIGVAILYNMGTNIFFGDISYITKAIASVLQLGVTTDFSIFLYHKYEKSKKENKDINKAMAIAIHETLVSIMGSSLTTIAGFLALCTMKLTLGTDIGIVMAKGVLFGLLCVVTIFPALLLTFDKQIEKTKHKVILPKFDIVKNFVIKNYKIIFVVFLLLLFPAYKSQSKTNVYYKLDESIPDDYGYRIATKTLKEEYGIYSQEMILVDSNMNNATMNSMVNEIKNIEGIDLVLSPSSLSELGLNEEMLSDDIRQIYQSDKHKLILVTSEYDRATEDLNNQIKEVNEIVKSYDSTAIVAGEGPLTKDLVEITDEDLKNVNTASIGVIFVLMLVVLKSISLPVLLLAAIEFAIFINMGVPYFTGTEIPFIASVVIGTIQLGATIDYAILMTTKYLEERKNGKKKEEAVKSALDSSVSSIVVSGLCFFCATIGVGIVSKIDMIGSLCTLISRGAIISMLVVIMVVPSLLMIFDKLICKTTIGLKNKKERKSNMNMKKIIKNATAWLLVISTFLTTMPVKALTKDETVYSKLDENGKTKYTMVTEHLINDEKFDSIVDSSNLTDIINTNGSEKYKIDGSKLTWEANKKDIFYKGNIDKELPVTLNVTYKLNGKETKVKDMLGKSGKVEITLKYKNIDKHTVNVSGKNTTMYTPFVVTMGTILDTKTTSNLKITNGKSITNGNTYVITGIASPGLYESLNLSSLKDMDKITITYDTTNFELNSIYSMVTSKLLDTDDLKVFDELDSMYSKVNVLKESSAKLLNGSKELTNGVQQVRNAVATAVKELENNNETLDENTLKTISSSAKEAAIKKVENSKNEIMTQAASEVMIQENQTHAIKAASDAGIDTNTSLVTALKLAAHEGLKAQMGEDAYNGCAMTNCPYIAAAENQAIEDAKDKFYQNALTLAKQTAGLTAYNTALKTAGTTAEETSIQVASVVALQVKNVVINKVVGSLNQLVGGLDSLLAGANTLSNGIEQFDNQGVSQISNLVTNTIKPTSAKVKALTKLANGYETFTKVTSNTKAKTKFILVIDGQKKEEKKTTKKEPKKENDTFVKRVVNLFK